MSNPNQLFLLADHIKLSLLERQRAQALNLDNDSQDGHLSRTLDQFRDGLASLEEERARLEKAGDSSGAQAIATAVPSLQKQLDDLTSQFHGFSTPSTTATLTHPNDPALQEDFAHAASSKPAGAGASSSSSPPAASSAAAPALSPSGKPKSGKTVRFRDSEAAARAAAAAASDQEADLEAQLFGRYRDDPDAPAGYRDEAAGLDNQQLHAYHAQILARQDEQLDRLGETIGRQRELSMQIGDELDSQVAMLDDVDEVVDRHQGRLDRARRQLGRVARAAGENKQMTTIVILIIVLVLLIAILK